MQSIIGMYCSVQTESWSVKLVEEHNEFINMIDSYWTCDKSETRAHIELF